MNINPNYLEITFDKAGIRNSQKRLKQLIADLAIEPLKAYQDDLQHKLSMVEEVVTRRVAKVIVYWLEHKADPVKPSSQDMMSSITNASRNDMSLEDFYLEQVKNGIYQLAPLFALEIPDNYDVDSEELEYALIELEDRFEIAETISDDDPYANYEDDPYAEYMGLNTSTHDSRQAARPVTAQPTVSLYTAPKRETATKPARQADPHPSVAANKDRQQEQALVVNVQAQQVEQAAPPTQVDINMLDMTAEQAWQLTYDLIGYNTEYIQGQMIPRWTQNPDNFEKDRRFLYQTFLDTIRNAAGVQMVAGNHRFSDRPMTIDQMWNYYFTDLSRNVGPLLSAAKLEASVNDPWYRRWWKTFLLEARKISPVWLIALVIALIFDGLTTFVSLDQTPMEGFVVMVFTVLITALFQIADVLVIDYRKREFEADAMVAKYKAQFERLTATLDSLDTTSDSFVQLSMQKSQAVADWKAAEDSRKMAQRGRFWSARIADINVIVTAYGFAFMFLNAEEPMYAFYQQVNYIYTQAWEQINLWVFLMIGLAVTVSFVINTAQRTEILGWSMRRLKSNPA